MEMSSNIIGILYTVVSQSVKHVGTNRWTT